MPEDKKELITIKTCKCFYYNFLFIAFLDYHLNKLYINKLHRSLFIPYPSLKPYFLTEVKRQNAIAFFGY